jgi:hypothetical protein
MSEFTKYVHHGKEVGVRKDLKGKHRDHCLCFDCDNFNLGTSFKCDIADELYKLCCKYNLTTPVFECPEFEEK